MVPRKKKLAVDMLTPVQKTKLARRWSASTEEILERCGDATFDGGSWSLRDALLHLLTCDDMFHAIIGQYGIPKAYLPSSLTVKAIDPFSALAKTIIYQQLAPAAAEKILHRCCDAFNVTDASSLRSEHVLQSSFEVNFVDGKKKIFINGTFIDVVVKVHYSDSAKHLSTALTSLYFTSFYFTLTLLSALYPPMP
jgi:hypothetical protein